MLKLLQSLKSNKSGASAAEYALIVAVMGGLVVAGSLAFGGSLQNAMSNSGQALQAQAGTTFNAP
jgi:pilus assembly protein Flp/PilA